MPRLATIAMEIQKRASKVKKIVAKVCKCDFSEAQCD